MLMKSSAPSPNSTESEGPPNSTRESENRKLSTYQYFAVYVMENDAVVYERQEEENNDLWISATCRFLQPHGGEWKV